jgi:hypothetical protein
MFIYDSDARLQLAREHAARLADEVRRSRRHTLDEAGHPSRASLRELLGRIALRRRPKEAEATVPAYDA